MFNLFKNLKKGMGVCEKNGVCASSPIINALNAVIINEVRQIAFYMVKLKDFNITNNEILKEAIYALSINITDVDFNKNEFIKFYLKLKNTKEKAKEFYINKCRELNTPYELINHEFDNENIKNDITSLIKAGEKLIKQFAFSTNPKKVNLIEVVILISKCASIQITKLNNFSEIDFKYYFEILRLITLSNNILTREEKLIRRIKEFSNILYEINKELEIKRQEKWGKKSSYIINAGIYEGKSILATGSDLEELYALLEASCGMGVNIYADTSLINAFLYPKFREFEHFKGLYGLNEFELDFTNFKGIIYVTTNSNKPVENIFRGKIYTTKQIPFDRAVKITKDEYIKLIEDAKNTEGFDLDNGRETINFEYNKEEFKKKIQEAVDKEIFLTVGLMDENVKNNKVQFNIFPPDEIELLYTAIENIDTSKLDIYFSICTKESIYTLLSILDKGIKNIYLTECEAYNINPHIVECLKENFGVKNL